MKFLFLFAFDNVESFEAVGFVPVPNIQVSLGLCGKRRIKLEESGQPLPGMDKARLVLTAHAWQAYSRHASSLCLKAAASEVLSPEEAEELRNGEFRRSVQLLCEHNLGHLVSGHFIDALEKTFKQQHAPKFWSHFEAFSALTAKAQRDPAGLTKLNEWVQAALQKGLAEVCAAKLSQEACLAVLIHAMRPKAHSAVGGIAGSKDFSYLLAQYHTTTTAILLACAPKYFSEVLNLYFKARLDEFSKLVKNQGSGSQAGGESEDESEQIAENPKTSSDEDDEMESVHSTRTSGVAEDMDVNGIGSLSGTRKARSGDEDESAQAMEGISYPAAHYKLSADASMDEIISVVGEGWVTGVGTVVRCLRELGFAAMSEDGYASAIYSLLRKRIMVVADKHYEKPVLRPICQWIEAVPLCFVSIILAASTSTAVGAHDFRGPLASVAAVGYGNGEAMNERIIRWRLRLQFFAYETLGDLRITELFDVIVDYPESMAAIEDLRQCLQNTGQHAKLVESFRAALRQRLLTAGAATTDILLQYVSTIKALRTMDPTGVVLEAVGEPIKEYLRGRKDTIRCIVTMLTDDSSGGGSSAPGGVGESLFEELSRGVSALENADSEDDGDVDGEEAWAAAERWEPDPIEADPSRTSKSRRLMDIISMLVGIYGSKELFVNEYRVMLAEKLLNKTDYDTDREIRTLELLKLRFGEHNMHSCEIMLKDVADSKRINTNIKASAAGSLGPTSASAVTALHDSTGPLTTSTPIQSRDSASFPSRVPAGPQSSAQSHRGEPEKTNPSGGLEAGGLSLDVMDASIISALFWPPFQAETIKVPEVVDKLLDNYAERYHALKTPRRLQWKKHLGTVKLELQFEDRTAQYVVTPVHAAIIMQFEKQSRWSAAELALAVGVPVSSLRRRIMLWVNQGVLIESRGAQEDDLVYTIVETMRDAGGRNPGVASVGGDAPVPLLGEEEGESAVASMEDQWQQEMNVYESYVVGMLTNFECLALDRIHNMLKMFVSDPPYDKTLPQLQGFLAQLISDEKLEIRDGMYRRRQQ